MYSFVINFIQKIFQATSKKKAVIKKNKSDFERKLPTSRGLTVEGLNNDYVSESLANLCLSKEVLSVPGQFDDAIENGRVEKGQGDATLANSLKAEN